jgi:hypothetical protein
VITATDPTVGELFALLDQMGVTRYQKMLPPTLPEYQGEDWRELTIEGVKDYYYGSGEPMGEKS